MEFKTFHHEDLNKTFVCRERGEFNPSKTHQMYKDNPDIDYTDLYTIHEMPNYLKNISLNKDDVWLDLGANIGCFGVLIYDKVKKIYGYEPEPVNFSILKEQIKQNKIKNYKIFKKCVIDNELEESVNLQCAKINTGHTILQRKNYKKFKIDEIINVPAISFTSLIKKHPDINRIKMDIEGAEYKVILSFDKWNMFDEIYFEWHNQPKDPNNEKYTEILDYLELFFKEVTRPRIWNGLSMVHCAEPRTNITTPTTKKLKKSKVLF